MKQQTAVEWLTDEMIKRDFFNKNKNLSFTTLEHLVNEAKKMEKQQIIDSWKDGRSKGYNSGCGDSETYYEETYTQSSE
jgi:hypothetical protein